VARGERVVDVHVGERAQPFGEAVFVLGLFGLAAEVGQHADLTRRSSWMIFLAASPAHSSGTNTSMPKASARRVAAASMSGGPFDESFGVWVVATISLAPRERAVSSVGSASRKRSEPRPSEASKSVRTSTRRPSSGKPASSRNPS
jgi:hypothetical protein